MNSGWPALATNRTRHWLEDEQDCHVVKRISTMLTLKWTQQCLCNGISFSLSLWQQLPLMLFTLGRLHGLSKKHQWPEPSLPPTQTGALRPSTGATKPICWATSSMVEKAKQCTSPCSQFLTKGVWWRVELMGENHIAQLNNMTAWLM